MLDLKPFFCYVPLDGTFFVLWSAGAETVSRNEAVISWEDCPHSFLFRLLETVYPEIPPGRMRKGVCRFVDKNRTQAGRFSSLLEQKKPFRKAVVLLNILHILNQVCGLAVQERTERFKVFPRHALLVPELLERGLAQQTFRADFVGIVALLFQSGQYIYFILQRQKNRLLFHCPYYSSLVARNQVQNRTRNHTISRAICQ